MKGLHTHKKVGFHHNAIHSKREPHPTHYLKQRASFWIASLSLFTFLVGNMMGQHGWYGFWASVLGEEDDTAIAYVGTGLPIAEIVDYGCWARYGGDFKVHTFRQAPGDCKKAMPTYKTSSDRDDIYSMQYMSSYEKTTEGSGHHSGVDIRVPVGTPILAVMNARVHKVGDQPRGFGKYIVLEHPNVPDPNDPNGKTTTLYSNYAHLSSILVEAGDIVHKSEVIGLSGNTGFSTGPHVDFMVVREGVPYLPFFPSNSREGYEYTVNPLIYVQSNFRPVVDQSTVVARAQRRAARAERADDVVVPRRVASSSSSSVRVVAIPDPTPEESRKTIIARLQSRREARIRDRLAKTQSRRVAIAANKLHVGVLPVAPEKEEPVVARREVAAESTVSTNEAGKVASVEIVHDGYFKGRWEKVRIRLLDSDGNRVRNPEFDHDIVVRIAHGEAKVRPAVLSVLDFEDGEAAIHILPRGRRAIVISVMPYNVVSKPMQFAPSY